MEIAYALLAMAQKKTLVEETTKRPNKNTL